MTPRFTVIRDTTPKAAIPRGAVVAMGNFDGVHLGHRAVIAAALRMGRAHGQPALAVTFEPHPRSFFSPNSPQFRLSDEAGKLRLLAGTGLAGAVVMTFDKTRAGTTAQDFIHHDLIERLGISGIAVGYDFHFGKGRVGSPSLLVSEAPRLGIYAVRVGRGQGKDHVRFDGVASFGRRPTFDNGAPLLEVFLFDFEGDLYGTALDVAFIGFIRDELKFDSVEALVRQMDDDSARARAALAAAPGAFPKLGTVGSSSSG